MGRPHHNGDRCLAWQERPERAVRRHHLADRRGEVEGFIPRPRTASLPSRVTLEYRVRCLGVSPVARRPPLSVDLLPTFSPSAEARP
jgi:hypothetical protein